MQLLAYTLVSSGLAGLAMTHAYLTHDRQFYPAAIHLSHSNAAVMAMMNMVLVSAILVGSLVKRIFIGPLRVIEQEHLYERLWFSISESCLAMTIFREDFSSQFVMFFTFLLLVKTFHWLAMDRVDFMEQAPQMPRSFHTKMPALIAILFCIDVWMVNYAVQVTYDSGPSMMLMFGFEFMILASTVVATFVKYVLHTVDQRRPDVAWEEKSVYIFYLELITDFIKLITYTCFFVIILSHYGLPLHIIRDLYSTLQNFINRLRSFIQYRRAMSNLNGRYPDATQAELDQTDRTCIICREDMDVAGQPKKLPCGHIFHFRCLRSWLERQQSCPTCRRSVLINDADPAAQPPRNNAQPPVGAPAVPAFERLPRVNVAAPAAQPRPPQPPPRSPPTTTTSPSSSRTPPAAPAGASSSSAPSMEQLSPPFHSVPHIPGFRLIPLFDTLAPPHGSPARFPVEHALPALTDEQLRQMEGSLRANVEERIRFLSGVQDEVASLVVRLNQYLSATESMTAAAMGQTISETDSGVAGGSGSDPVPDATG